LKTHFPIQAQPNDITCGPTCLHAVYQYYQDLIPLKKVIQEVHQVKGGGTLAVFMGIHALKKGYEATLYSYNLKVFDPTWFHLSKNKLVGKLTEQLNYKTGKRLQSAINGYISFLKNGGEIKFTEMNGSLFRKYLKKNIPIITGLSATYLYHSAREIANEEDPTKSEYHDIKGEPTGHFVVLLSYDKESRKVLVADPLYPNPFYENQRYEVNIDRLICSILLGILTYDANLLVIHPPEKSEIS
jgi:hypothetical protein